MKNTLKFGFVVYPENFERLYSFFGAFQELAKKIPKLFVKRIVCNLYPKRVFRVKIQSMNGKEIEGIFVLCPLFPDQFVALNKEIVLKKIKDSVILAQKFGAKIVGLAGFTSIFSNQGLDLTEDVKVCLTTGNTFTAALTLEGILKAVNMMDYNLNECTMTIIGATGDIGSICTEILSTKVKRLNLLARDKAKLLEFKNNLSKSGMSEITVMSSITEAVKESNIVLICSSSMTKLFDADNLKNGTVLCDISIPANTAIDVNKNRDDVLAFEGGYAWLPYFDRIIDLNFKKQFKHSAIFGCLAETITLTFEEKFENYSLGRGCITKKKVDEIMMLGNKNGIKIAPFFCGERMVRVEDINIIKNQGGKEFFK